MLTPYIYTHSNTHTYPHLHPTWGHLPTTLTHTYLSTLAPYVCIHCHYRPHTHIYLSHILMLAPLTHTSPNTLTHVHRPSLTPSHMYTYHPSHPHMHTYHPSHPHTCTPIIPHTLTCTPTSPHTLTRVNLRLRSDLQSGCQPLRPGSPFQQSRQRLPCSRGRDWAHTCPSGPCIEQPHERLWGVRVWRVCVCGGRGVYNEGNGGRWGDFNINEIIIFWPNLR